MANLDKIIEDIKAEGCIEPKIGIVTPEIRTIDERAINSTKYIESIKEVK